MKGVQNDKIKKILSFSFVFLSLFCAKKRIVEIRRPADLVFQEGVEFLNQGRYKEAVKRFEEVISNYPGSGYLEDASFFLAEAYLRQKDFFSARDEFLFFMKNFPGSKYAEEASYKFAYASLAALPKIAKDQEEIFSVEEFILDFKERYPNSFYQPKMDSLLLEIRNRQAKKDFDNGLLYYKVGEIEAAKVYFEYIVEEFSETETAWEAKFFLGEIFFKNGERDKAKEIFEELLEKPLREEMKEKMRRYLRMM